MATSVDEQEKVMQPRTSHANLCSWIMYFVRRRKPCGAQPTARWATWRTPPLAASVPTISTPSLRLRALASSCRRGCVCLLRRHGREMQPGLIDSALLLPAVVAEASVIDSPLCLLHPRLPGGAELTLWIILSTKKRGAPGTCRLSRMIMSKSARRFALCIPASVGQVGPDCKERRGQLTAGIFWSICAWRY